MNVAHLLILVYFVGTISVVAMKKMTGSWSYCLWVLFICASFTTFVVWHVFWEPMH